MQGLPSLEKLTSQIKGAHSTDKKTEITEEIEEPKSGLLEGIPSLNHFLTKGIILKISEEKMKLFTKKDSSYSGYLDLDIEKLKNFIKSRFPDILKD